MQLNRFKDERLALSRRQPATRELNQLPLPRIRAFPTNAGVPAASGDFVSFFDHDDILEPDLFFSYAEAIENNDNVDLLYCDEDKLMPDGKLAQPFFKPDFNIDLLRNNNYICHMLTIRKSLLDTLEPNTKEFDGAQDHNLTLRAVEKARNVHHVAKVLYHWRLSET